MIRIAIQTTMGITSSVLAARVAGISMIIVVILNDGATGGKQKPIAENCTVW